MNKFKKISLSALITLIGFMLVFLGSTTAFDKKKTEEFYKQGLGFEKQKNWQDAYYNFSRVPSKSSVYEPALVKQALCADELKDFNTAIKKYEEFTHKYPNSLLFERAQYNLAKNYFQNDQIDKSRRIFERIIKKNKNEEFSIAANYFLGEIFKEKKPQKAKSFYIQYLRQSPEGRYAQNCRNAILGLDIELTQSDKILLQTGSGKKNDVENAPDYKLYKLAQKASGQEKINYWTKIVEQYPRGDFASESLWELFWNAYKNKDYKKAKMLGKKHIAVYSNALAAPKILFWMGRICEIEHDKTQANGYYNRILTKYPDSYYAFRANAKLIPHKQNWDTTSKNRLPKNVSAPEFPISQAQLNVNDIKLINMLTRLEDFALLEQINFNNKFIESWLNNKSKNYPYSTFLAREAINEMDIKPDFTDDVYKLAYPILYGEQINAGCLKYSLDEYLIIALIKEESHFDKNIKSQAGAIGLMQVMPSSAQHVASVYSMPFSGGTNLFDANTNISFGCAYYHFAKSNLYNNDLLAVAAYNGGPNAVAYWHQNLSYKDFDEFVEHIPYQETKDYVKKIYRSYWNYLNIYK